MSRLLMPLLYTTWILAMSASCAEKTVSINADCEQLPTVLEFKDQEATVEWHPSDYPEREGVLFKKDIGNWNVYRICMSPKELQIDGLKIRCTGRTVKTQIECAPNVKGCNLNSVIIKSYEILETPIVK